MLRSPELSCALWNDNTNTIVLEDENYKGHIKDYPEDADFLNVLIENYNQMDAIFSIRHAIISDPIANPISQVDNEDFCFLDIPENNTTAGSRGPPPTWNPPNDST
ncbi:hypothetical protein GUJ93_ZPchr0005g14635 [Zizania palustris]|uniref:Uncharacterized protein n=1 Tax=Zizania palustris TaxID=103762 RepID=A0A8J5W202_ZIZPA|nr:hypothetical protein GUJ93_ZPchr0005g14635 [Zizania palustris]